MTRHGTKAGAGNHAHHAVVYVDDEEAFVCNHTHWTRSKALACAKKLADEKGVSDG